MTISEFFKNSTHTDIIEGVRKEFQRQEDLKSYVYSCSPEQLHSMGYTDSEIESAVKEIRDEKDRIAAVARLMPLVFGNEDRHPYER